MKGRLGIASPLDPVNKEGRVPSQLWDQESHMRHVCILDKYTL